MAAGAGDGKKAGNLQRSYFDVLGICCSSEIPLIENILKPLEGVKEISVIVTTRTVIVVHDSLLISQAQIVKALNGARLEANVRVYGDEKSHRKKWPSPYAVASGLLLLLSLLKFVNPIFRWAAVGAVAAGIWPIASKSFAAIRSLRIDINILALIAVIGTIGMKDYLEAATIVFLFTIAEWLESRAGHKANAVMSSLLSMAPQKAVLADTGEVVGADEVKLGTLLAVKPGEVIPIDGIVVEGECEVDEKTLTGESFPAAKQKNSTVWAGTINLNGYVTVKTTAVAEDCVVAKMAKLVEDAQNNKSKIQRFIDKCAKFYTPAVVVVSSSIAVIPVALRLHNRNHWFQLALVVLVSACPCALILSTPVATFCALTKAATSGLLIKGGDFLEALAKIKVIAFDKTGTITRGEFMVTEFQALHQDSVSLNTLLYWVSSIESKSSHPMATALVDHGRSLSIDPKPENVGHFQNFPGEGVNGKIDGNDVYIGNRRIATRANCTTVPELKDDAKDGRTVGYIFCGATLVGIFRLSDSCRTGAKEAMEELKSLGIKTAMLTGDSSASALQAQKELGKALEIVHAELLPEDKTKLINTFKKEGPTAMIGDGLNDAPALATADIGISMGISGSALAIETGDIILLSNDIRKIPKAIQLARKTHRKVIENVVLSLTPRLGILGLAFAGHPLVWAAVLADVGTCVLVILNSMLLLRGTNHHKLKAGKYSASDGACKRQCCPVNSTFDHHDHHDSSHSPNHHVSKDCCSQKKTLEDCLSDNYASKCCSSTTNLRSCGKTKSVDSTCEQAEDSEHGCCSQENKQKCGSMGHTKTSISSSCEKINCTNSTSSLGGSAGCVELHESRCCAQSHHQPRLRDHIIQIPECNAGDLHSFSPGHGVGSGCCSPENSHKASFPQSKCRSKACGETKCVGPTVRENDSPGSLKLEGQLHCNLAKLDASDCDLESQKKFHDKCAEDESRHCKASCCGKNGRSDRDGDEHHLSAKSEAFQEVDTRHCKATCYENNGRSKEDCDEHHLNEKPDGFQDVKLGHCKSSCCETKGRSNRDEEERHLNVKPDGFQDVKLGHCKSSCCETKGRSNRGEEERHLNAKPDGFQDVKLGDSKSFYCETKGRSNRDEEERLLNAEPDGLQDVKLGHCKSSCCETKGNPNRDEEERHLNAKSDGFQETKLEHCKTSCCEKKERPDRDGGEHHLKLQNEGVHPSSKTCGGNSCRASETAANIELGAEHLHLKATHSYKAVEEKEKNSCCKGHKKECPEDRNEQSCGSLEKREMGGCCKSYMKECCRKHGDIGTTVHHCGLNEIVIE